jgi:glycosyltransferase involved in cell wall biosynthesis
MKIAAISETLIGYGSPQIPKFSTEIGRHFGARTLVFTPYDEVKPRNDLYPEIDIEVIPCRAKRFHPLGRAEYTIRVAQRLNELKPDVIVAFCTYSLPALLRLAYQPKKIIYYSLESLTNYDRTEELLNKKLASKFDVVIYPEFNRVALDGTRGGLLDRPTAIMLNNVHALAEADEVLPADRRNRRIIHPGSIAVRDTFAEYYVDPRSQSYPLDIYGIVYGQPLKDSIARLSGNVRYLGVVDEATLAKRRRDYSWGLVMWNPDSENGRLAAPNKLFDYIASGVPALAAPHPQAAEIIARFGCGILMPDWSYASFQWAIEEALSLSGSPQYAGFVEGCVRAQRELCWENQFEKFLRLL